MKIEIPLDYRKISLEEYKNFLFPLTIHDNKEFDKWGMPKDVNETEYLFLFKHTDKNLECQALLLKDKKNDWFFPCNILVRDFSYYSDKIMLNQIKNYREIMSDLVEAFNSEPLFFSLKIINRVYDECHSILNKHIDSKYWADYNKFAGIIGDLKKSIANGEMDEDFNIPEVEFSDYDILSQFSGEESFGELYKGKFNFNYGDFKDYAFIIGKILDDLRQPTQRNADQAKLFDFFCKYFTLKSIPFQKLHLEVLYRNHNQSFIPFAVQRELSNEVFKFLNKFFKNTIMF